MARVLKNNSVNFLVSFIIFTLVFGWLYSGWPNIWKNPTIPPEIQKAQAADIRVLITTIASTTWLVPTNWNYASNTIEVIGGGGGGRARATNAAGGGGGAYAKIANIKTLTPNSTIYVSVGAGGGSELSGTDTWFNDTTATTSDCGDQSVCAKAGITGVNDGTAGAGGASSTSIGDTKNDGGTGNIGTQNGGNGGGGGAAGLGGPGRNGGAGDSVTSGDDAGGGGGGAGGGLSTVGTGGTATFGAGGAGPSGSGGGATAGAVGSVGGGGAGGAHGGSGGKGGDGTEWTTGGAGGGGGGSGNGGLVGGDGGAYGGGGGGGTTGGTGGVGIIIITYVPAVAPGAPTGLATTTVGNAQVDLSWASSTDGGSYITYYNIYRGTASPATTLVASSTNATYSDTSVVNGTKYFYRVTAVNIMGGSGYSNEIFATPMTVPGAPTGLATTTVDTQVGLTWTAPASDGGSPILYYNIYRDTASPATTFLASTTATTYSDTTVAGGTKYYYRVTAVNAVGPGNYSNEIFADPPAAGTVSCDVSISATSFGPLSELTISTASLNASTTMSCTFAGGCTLWVQDEGNGSNPGLATTSPPYLIPSNTATLSVGGEGYGIQAATNTAGLSLSGIYNKSGNDVGGLSRTLIRLASSSAPITGGEVLITHKAAISATTPPGTYTDAITYNCLGN